MDSGFAPMAFGFVMVVWVFCGSVIGFAVCRVLLVLWVVGYGFVDCGLWVCLLVGAWA